MTSWREIVKVILWLTFLLGGGISMVNAQNGVALAPTKYQKVTFKWQDKDLFEATLKVQLMNSGSRDAHNVFATISRAPKNNTIVDGEVSFGDIAAGSKVWSRDSFTIRTDLSNPVDPQEGVYWRIEYDTPEGKHRVIEDVPQFGKQ